MEGDIQNCQRIKNFQNSEYEEWKDRAGCSGAVSRAPGSGQQSAGPGGEESVTCPSLTLPCCIIKGHLSASIGNTCIVSMWGKKQWEFSSVLFALIGFSSF